MSGRATATPSASPLARASVLAVAVAVVAFELGSFAYLRHESADFIVARRTASPPRYWIGDALDWSATALGALAGWARPEATGTWSLGPSSSMIMTLSEAPGGDLRLTVRARALVHPDLLPARTVEVLANGTPVAQWQFTDDKAGDRTARIPRDVVGPDRMLRLDFRYGDVRSPAALGIGGDSRRIAMQVQRWRIDVP